MATIREPIVEGIFYPSDRRKLQKLIQALLEDAAPVAQNAWGVISPHAGLRYSGAIAATALKAAGGRPVKTIVILAPCHRSEKDEVIFPESGNFKMPSGLIPVDLAAVDELLGFSTRFLRDDIPHLEEHSIEVQLPFVSALFPKADIVPILVGRIGRKTVGVLASALLTHFAETRASTLFIVSANLTSFLQGGRAKDEAEALLRFILANDADGLLTAYETGKISSIGVPAVAALLFLAGRESDIRYLSGGSSADVNRDYESMTQYAAIGFFRKQE